ncbi:YgaP family membrane protein [Pseudovibrio exalbescens]|uniref:Inner membrane protein YgaP-like transmembrane domain-containing protein n=1 Tax=Pseudovibrio exalbescens TaxID=197461 RepID=A0A1U7JFA9_9HYPH|nr:DUF2892 domain-containing protein [Pseudovibrio exalbescens]OKL43331.1 hypothetical protein A3843_13980 [Pseudovibrio exalbescens]
MTTNVGTIDRLVRALIGIVLIVAPFTSALALFAEPLYRYGSVALGCIMLVVAATRFCPLYALFGFKTCRT